MNLELFPIKTESDYKKALRIIEETPVGSAEVESQIEILSQLVKHWETQHHAFEEEVSPGEVLRELMILKKKSPKDVSELLDTPTSNVSAILSGKRKLNLDQATTIALAFGIDPTVFGNLKRARFPRIKATPKLEQRA